MELGVLDHEEVCSLIDFTRATELRSFLIRETPYGNLSFLCPPVDFVNIFKTSAESLDSALKKEKKGERIIFLFLRRVLERFAAPSKVYF